MRVLLTMNLMIALHCLSSQRDDRLTEGLGMLGGKKTLITHHHTRQQEKQAKHTHDNTTSCHQEETS
jgi:hypothetical protein